MEMVETDVLKIEDFPSLTTVDILPLFLQCQWMGPDFIIGKTALKFIGTNFPLHINASRIAILNLKYTFLRLSN